MAWLDLRNHGVFLSNGMLGMQSSILKTAADSVELADELEVG